MANTNNDIESAKVSYKSVESPAAIPRNSIKISEMTEAEASGNRTQVQGEISNPASGQQVPNIPN